MALSTLAEWTGSGIINNLVDKAFSFLSDRMLPADTQVELNRLNVVLPKIIAVMRVAEALKLKYPNSGVDAWLGIFKVAFLAAEDVLDELEYRKLEDMVKSQDQVCASSSSILGRLKRKFCGPNINHDTLGRLQEAVRMLDEASKDVGDFYKLATELHFVDFGISNRETSCILNESNVVGRETEKATIIEWLKKQVPHSPISAFCIVGAGGLGKTTLAQLISEEMSRENLFDKTIWVCISTNFNVKDITRKILEQLGEGCHGGESLNSLQIKLKKMVHSKKLLFILDDVWNEDKICDWEKLVAPLRCAHQGSKILLTTRMKSVADMLCRVLNVEREFLDLCGLKEKQLLSLFNKYAFPKNNPDHHEDLKEIANEIIKKLWGSPLAAKVIGSLLNSNLSSDYWGKIWRYNSLINLEQAKEVVDVLKLSYYHLSADLQQCFRFCSIFPQDHKFDKIELIRMWVASGFIRQRSCGEERLEDIGEEYFNHLLRKSFFELHTMYDGRTYIMHDMMHELAQNVSKGECLRVDPNNKSVDIPSTVQHVYVHFCEIEKIFHLRNLRTLVTMLTWDKISEDDRTVLPTNSLKETLRILFIWGNRSFELPEEIDHLIHLRFLKAINVSGSLISNSIGKLYHLQVLELSKDCIHTKEWYRSTDYLKDDTTRLASFILMRRVILSKEIVKYIHGVSGVGKIGLDNLISLRHMNLPIEIIKNIHGVHKLTNLQELTFCVERDSGRHIDELKTLNNLKHLFIKQIENVGDPAQAKNVNLYKKESLLSLSLNWTSWSNPNNLEPEDIIDNLQPQANIRELEINNYKGHRFPIWLRNLPPLNISLLMLSNCPLLKSIPCLAKLLRLKILSLSEMSEVKEVDYSSNSTRNACAFPSLERLYCHKMPKWQSWAGSLSCHGFPNLKTLEIVDCPNLAQLPAMPLSLLIFELRNVGLHSLPNMHHNSSITTPALASTKSVTIFDCPNLQSLNGFLQQENIDFQALEDLNIHKCENLVQLPTSTFGKFVSLNFLNITTCPKLVAVDNQTILLPPELNTLVFGDCGEIDVILLESASNHTTLSALQIEDSETITCIPCSENAFASLSSLSIQGCNKLDNSSMEIADGVNEGNHMTPLRIEEIDISCLPLLSIEPFRSLRFVTRCNIRHSLWIEALPEQWLLQNSSTLEELFIANAPSLKSLPDTMVRLNSLKVLKIWYAFLLEQIPELPPSLVELEIGDAPMQSLPDTMVRLTALEELNIHGATSLQKIPELPDSLVRLLIEDATSLRSLPDTMVRLTALKELDIQGATSLQNIPKLPPSLVKTTIKGSGGIRLV